MIDTALASTFHDPPGRMYAQLERVLPRLRDVFAAIVVTATDSTDATSLDLLRDAGVDVMVEASGGLARLGRVRREVVGRALNHGTSAIMYCDADRVLHWMERYADELRAVAADLHRYDVTVLGRTARAFESHPRIQRDTEMIINHVYATLSGTPWDDVTAAARGFGRRTAERLVTDHTDDTVGVDCTWPLWALRQPDFAVRYRPTEGLEFETADRFGAEVEAAGGIDHWIALLDADPRLWAERLELARMEVEAMQLFAPPLSA